MTMSAPLSGTLVIDCSRMLPGAVLARNLIDLGARLIKIEDPREGDPMRLMPPLVDGVGVGFCVYYRGAESLRLDLRTREGITLLRRLLARADLFIESFRPGTLAQWFARWGLMYDAVEREYPRLIRCSLPAYAADDRRVGHDLNLTGLTGLLGQLPGSRLTFGSGDDIPRVLMADVLTGVLATSSVLAALLARANSSEPTQNLHIQQPLLSAPLPLVTWPWADRAAGGGGALETVLSGRAACYRCYRCADGKLLSVGCLEPKFWTEFCQAIGKPELANLGHDLSERGRAAADTVAEVIASQPRSEWLALLADKNLPVAAVHDLDDARSDATLASSGLLEHTPMPGGGRLSVPGPALPSLGRTPDRPAPKLGEHDEAILHEFTPPVGSQGL